MVKTGRAEQSAEYYNKAYIKAANAYSVHWKKSRYLKLFEQVEKFLPEDKTIPIMDIGCGAGQLTAMLLDKGWENVIGFDYSKTAIEMAKKNFPEYSKNFFLADINKMEISQDKIILLTEVLEHIENDLEVIKKLANHKAIIISVPSFDDPGHVRYFKTWEQVADRYSEYFTSIRIEQVGAWFVMFGSNNAEA